MFDVTVDVRQNNRLRFSVTRSSRRTYNQVITDLKVREQFVVIEERKGEEEGDCSMKGIIFPLNVYIIKVKCCNYFANTCTCSCSHFL